MIGERERRLAKVMASKFQTTSQWFGDYVSIEGAIRVVELGSIFSYNRTKVTLGSHAEKVMKALDGLRTKPFASFWYATNSVLDQFPFAVERNKYLLDHMKDYVSSMGKLEMLLREDHRADMFHSNDLEGYITSRVVFKNRILVPRKGIEDPLTIKQTIRFQTFVAMDPVERYNHMDDKSCPVVTEGSKTFHFNT